MIPDTYLTYCGLYCGACTSMMAAEKKAGDPSVEAQIVDDSPCQGCKIEGNTCEFAICCEAHSSSCCGFCLEFPCERIVEFSKTEWPHHQEVIHNLTRLKEIGEEAWLTEQVAKWSCQGCGARTHWYQATCHNCGRIWEPLYT